MKLDQSAPPAIPLLIIQSVAQQSSVASVCTTICESLLLTLSCRGISFCLTNEYGDELEVGGNVGNVPEQALQSASLLHDEPTASCDGLNKIVIRVALPWDSTRGFITCLRQHPFSPGDHEYIHCLGLLAMSYIVALRTRNESERSFSRLVHEMTSPLAAVRGALGSINKELSSSAHDFRNELRHDYLGDISSWVELMTGLTGNATLSNRNAPHPEPMPGRTYLMSDVIAPAVRQVDARIRARGFPLGSILYENLERIPALWIDRRQFQQVVFNLLSNAVKYAHKDPQQFRVLIRAERFQSGFSLSFQDWGVGVEAGTEEKIFQHGFRAPSVAATTVGSGLGLWIVRRIIEAHGGRIITSRLREPTEFTITLPEGLADRH